MIVTRLAWPAGQQGDGRRRPGCCEDAGGSDDIQPTPRLPPREDPPAQRGPGGGGKLATRGVTVGGVLRECDGEHVVERRREVRPYVGELGRRLVEVCEDDRELGVTLVRARPGQALVEDARERVLVGAPVDRAALDLLGRDVVDRADEAAVAGQARDRRDVAGDAEVADERALGGDQDVARLDVAMHEAGSVRNVEARGDLLDQRHRALRLERAVLCEQPAQVLTVDQLHRQVEPAVVVACRQDAHDVLVIKAGRDLGLA